MSEINAPVADAPKSRGKRRFWIALGVVAGTPILAFLALWAYASTIVLRTPYSDREPIAFTREGWQESTHDGKGSRFLMMDDLIAKHPLVGMERQSVINLLGPFHPGDYPGFRDCYYLGPEDHPLAVDNAWLVLTFENDIVTKWVIATD